MPARAVPLDLPQRLDSEVGPYAILARLRNAASLRQVAVPDSQPTAVAKSPREIDPEDGMDL
jgi:hypothetical protein